jgi:hypothetical protein
MSVQVPVRRRRPQVAPEAQPVQAQPVVQTTAPRRGGRTTAPPTVESLTARLNYAEKRVAFAWAKYYNTVRESNEDDNRNYHTITRIATTEVETMPIHIKNELKEMAEELKKKWECPICQDFIEGEQLDITNCGHFYCKGCLNQWKEACKGRGDAKWECCTCKRKHNYKDE